MLTLVQEVILNVRPLGSVVTSLPTDQEILGSISGSAVGFFSGGELFPYKKFMFQCPCPCSVLGSLWRWPLHSADYRSGEPTTFVL